MTKSKYYIDFSDSIKNLSKEVNNANDFHSKIPEKDDMTKEFNNLEFLQNIEFGDNYSIESRIISTRTATAKYRNDGFEFSNKKRIKKVSSISEFNGFISSLEDECNEINNAYFNLNILIDDLSKTLSQINNELNEIKIDGKSIIDLSTTTLKSINK